MKNIIASLFVALLLQTAAHAAPMAYRFTSTFQWYESIDDGSPVSPILAPEDYLLPENLPLVIDFTYSDAADFAPIDIPATAYPGTYRASASSNAITGIEGTIGAHRFAADSLYSQLFTTHPDPGAILSGNFNLLGGSVGAVNGQSTGSGFEPFVAAGMPLAYMSIEFYHDVSPEGAPFDMSAALKNMAQVNLNFDMGDGKTLNATYFGQLQAVPVPAAFWLFGSGLAGMVGLKRRTRKE